MDYHYKKLLPISGWRVHDVLQVIRECNLWLQKDEEWIDFQEPTEKDYSGLRIQSLQIV